MSLLSELKFIEDPLKDTANPNNMWVYHNHSSYNNYLDIATVDGIKCLDVTQAGGGVADSGYNTPGIKTSGYIKDIVTNDTEYTISVWVYLTHRTDGAFFSTIYPVYTGAKVTNLGFRSGGATTLVIYPEDRTITYNNDLNKWYHVMVTRTKSNTIRYFFGGNLIYTGTYSYDPLIYGSATGLIIGSIPYSGTGNVCRQYRFKGYMRSFEIHDVVLETSSYNQNKYWRLYNGLYISSDSEVWGMK